MELKNYIDNKLIPKINAIKQNPHKSTIFDVEKNTYIEVDEDKMLTLDPIKPSKEILKQTLIDKQSRLND